MAAPVRERAAAPLDVTPGFADPPLERPLAGDRVLALERLAGAERLAQYGAAEQALAPVRAALAADPSCVEARLLHAKLLLEPGPLHDPLAGLREARLAALVAPEQPAVVATEALARFLLGDSLRAEPLLERCAALPEGALSAGLRAATLEAHGFLLLRHGALDAAGERMAAAAALRPQRGYTRYGLARVAGERGDLATELAELDAAVRCDPHLLVAWHERAQLLRRAKRVEEADRARRIAELLRELQDDTSERFAQDHAGKARRWLELAKLDDTAQSWLARFAALTAAHDHATVAREGELWLACHPLRGDLVVETARAQARLGEAGAARATLARLAECRPRPPPELEAALARELEALLRAAPRQAGR
ncbi:MAG: hypothetical protein JNL90_13095 [Planctomycetes bacterium]|nr:hypothetical protein [Planctomycetota bacterium]